MAAARENDNVVVWQIADQRTKIVGHHYFPVSCGTQGAIDAPWIDQQTAAPIFSNVLYEPEHGATRPAVLLSAGSVPEQLAREKLVDVGSASHEVRQLTIQQIEHFQCHQNPGPLLAKLVRDRTYQLRNFVGPVDFAEHDHPLLEVAKEMDVVEVAVLGRPGCHCISL